MFLLSHMRFVVHTGIKQQVSTLKSSHQRDTTSGPLSALVVFENISSPANKRSHDRPQTKEKWVTRCMNVGAVSYENAPL